VKVGSKLVPFIWIAKILFVINGLQKSYNKQNVLISEKIPNTGRFSAALLVGCGSIY